jgi:hypothetical protein
VEFPKDKKIIPIEKNKIKERVKSSSLNRARQDSSTDNSTNNQTDTNPFPEPEPTPNPDPQPNPEPTPNPDPQPNPNPTPNPDPQPNPNPTPNPKPNPNPNPKPNPNPSPSTDDDVYYVPKIGGIKINNPLPQNMGVIGCKNCSPDEMAAEKQSKEGISFSEEPGVRFQKVDYIKELSPGGKAALELEKIDDPEYKRIIKAGYENPTFSDKIIEKYDTGVSAPANVNYKWEPSNSRDEHMWQDVEYNRYNQRLLDSKQFMNTPAHFTTNDGGNTNIVHAPSNSGLQIISPASTTISALNSFIETDSENLEENEMKTFLGQ